MLSSKGYRLIRKKNNSGSDQTVEGRLLWGWDHQDEQEQPVKGVRVAGRGQRYVKVTQRQKSFFGFFTCRSLGIIHPGQLYPFLCKGHSFQFIYMWPLGEKLFYIHNKTIHKNIHNTYTYIHVQHIHTYTCAYIYIHIHIHTYMHVQHTHRYAFFEDTSFMWLKWSFCFWSLTISTNCYLTWVMILKFVHYIWELILKPLGQLPSSFLQRYLPGSLQNSVLYMQKSMVSISQGQSEGYLAFSYFNRLFKLLRALTDTLKSYDNCDLLPEVRKQMCSCLFHRNIKQMPQESSPS